MYCGSILTGISASCVPPPAGDVSLTRTRTSRMEELRAVFEGRTVSRPSSVTVTTLFASWEGTGGTSS